MAGNERNESDTSKRNSFAANTSSSNLLSRQELNKSFNLSTASSINGTRVIRKMIPVDPDKLRQFGLDLKIKKAVSQSIAKSSSLLRGQELIRSFDHSTAATNNESIANRKMITLDPDKLRQFGLDLKFKKAVPQNIGVTVNKAFSPANRTVKLVQKVKVTPALSPKRAEKIPETSINLNMLQQQISDKLKMNNSFPSPVANQNIKSTQEIKMSPITNIKMTKIIPKEESYGDRAIHDTDNNFRGWPDDEKGPKANTVWINNTNLGRLSSQTTVKGLADTIKSNSTSTPRRNSDIRTHEVVTVKNGTVINSRASNTPEGTSHRMAPKQVEVSKVVKTTGKIKNQCTFQGSIVDNTRPPAVTYDINSISTSNGASISDNISPKPMRVAHTPKSPVKLNYSTYVKPQEQRDNSVEFSKIHSKSLGGRKPQKIWSRFNKFKKKNKMLQMENQELKNRLHSLMENMNSINSINPFEVIPGPNPSLPVETCCRVQPISIDQDATKPRTHPKPKPCTIFEKNIPISINKEILQIRREVASKQRVQINAGVSSTIKPIQDIKTDQAQKQQNNHKYFSQTKMEVIKQSELDINRHKLFSIKSEIKSKESAQPVVAAPVIINDYDNEMPVPEIARELEIRDQSMFESHDEIEIIISKPKLLSLNDDLNYDEDLHDDMNLEMNISVDSSREHDYSFREKVNAPFESYESESIDLTLEESPAPIELKKSKKPKFRSNIVVLENRLLLPNENPQTVPIYSNIGMSKSTTNHENIIWEGQKPTPTDVNKISHKQRKSSRYGSSSEETSQEIMLTVDTSDPEDLYIEPPAYSPIEPISKPITPLNGLPVSNAIEASNIPLIILGNLTTTNSEIRINEESQLEIALEKEIPESICPLRNKEPCTTTIIRQNESKKQIPSHVKESGDPAKKRIKLRVSKQFDAAVIESISPASCVESELQTMNNLNSSSLILKEVPGGNTIGPLGIQEKLAPTRKPEKAMEEESPEAFTPLDIASEITVNDTIGSLKKTNKLCHKLTDLQKSNSLEFSVLENIEQVDIRRNPEISFEKGKPESCSPLYIKPLLGTIIAQNLKKPTEIPSTFDKVISNTIAKQNKCSPMTTVLDTQTSNQISPSRTVPELRTTVQKDSGLQKTNNADFSLVASNETLPESIEPPKYQGKIDPRENLEVDLQKVVSGSFSTLHIENTFQNTKKQRRRAIAFEEVTSETIGPTEKPNLSPRTKRDSNLKALACEQISLLETDPKHGIILHKDTKQQKDNKQISNVVALTEFPLEQTMGSLENEQQLVHDTTQDSEQRDKWYQDPSLDVFEVIVTTTKRQRKDDAGLLNSEEASVTETIGATKNQEQFEHRRRSRIDSKIVPAELLSQSLLESSQDTEQQEVLTTRLKRQRKPKLLPSPEVTVTPVPLSTKIRRQSRKTISPLSNDDVTPAATIKSSAEKRISTPRVKSAPRKRIKLAEEIILYQSDDEDFLGFPDNAVLPVPILEIMTEIKVEPHFDDTTDVLVGQKKTAQAIKTVTCGNCKETLLKKQWPTHLRKHNGLGYREGLDPPFDLTDYRKCLNVMTYYMKMNKITQVTCEKCGTTRKSALGLIAHIKICGLSEEEKRIPCIHCGKRLLEMSIPIHWQHSCSVLKRKEMFEHMEKNESELNLEEEKEDTAEVTTSGRAKRKSVKAAEKKIKSFIELIDDVNVDVHFSEKKPPKIYGGTKRSWASQLQKNGEIKCKIKNCDFKVDSVQGMFLHATTCRNPNDVYGFYCRHCNYYSLAREPIVEHITKEHVNILTNMTKFENQSGSEASAGEESSESDGSSGEEEIECDAGSDIEVNDDDILDDSSKERSRVRSSVGTASGNGSGEYKTTESAEALLRDYSLVIKQPHVNSSFYHFAFKWTTQFVEKYFACDPLYLNFRPIITSYINEADANEYIPKPKKSPKFSFRLENVYQADWGILASKVKSEDWDHLELFNGKYNQKQNIILYCGGPILCLDWATFPVSYKEDQYLAVYCYQDYKDSTRSNELKSKKGLIQVWNLGNLNKKQEPVMKYAFTVDYGPVCDIKFCPSGGYIPSERIGLLAVTSLVGDVYIFSLPFNIDVKQVTNIIELQPSITLRPCINDTTRCRQGYRLSWTKDKEHSIIATGYTDGWVAIWNLKTESKLLKRTINCQQVIIPTKIFHPFAGIICGIEIFHVNNSQWLMVAADKDVKLFDLKTYAYPLEVSNVYQKSTITGSAWSIHWPGYLLGLNECFCLLRNSVTLTQPHEIGYKNYPMQSFDATVTDIAVSDYLNAYTAGTDSGDIICYLPRDLLLNLSRKGNRRIKMISGFTDTIELDTESGSDIPSKFGVVFCDLAEPVLSSLSDLKSKRHRRWPLEHYPIVTITRVKFNPNENVHKYYALGTQAGFVRIRYMVPRRNC